MSECSWPGCKAEANHGANCYMHFRAYGAGNLGGGIKEEPEPAEKPKKPIAKKSVKAAKDDKEYKKLVKLMLSENDKCEMKVPGVCTGKANGLHHKRKRGKHTMKDKKNLLRACNACNGWVEANPIEAEKLGLVETKFKQTV
jgi:hypothetical protein